MASHQSFLDSEKAAPNPNRSELTILSWNVRNPSWKTASRQIHELVSNIHADVLILTELKNPSGVSYYADRLNALGYRVFVPNLDKDYCVLIASNTPAQPLGLEVGSFGSRIIGVSLQARKKPIKVVGVYGVARWPIAKKRETKKRFQDQVRTVVRHMEEEHSLDGTILMGDLNIVNREHQPHHAEFEEWEYEFYDSLIQSGLVDAYRYLNSPKEDHSWFGISGKDSGYRLDHAFVSKDLLNHLSSCEYLHFLRAAKLSDHSGLRITLRL